jgi:hypothetical protein
MRTTFFTNRQRRNGSPIEFALDVVSNPLNRAEASRTDLFIQDLNAELSFEEENQLHEHKRRETIFP